MIRRATAEDVQVVANLAVILWNHHTVDELISEFDRILKNKEAAVFFKYVQDVPVGFAQCQLRHDYVEGTKSSPVGYLEGIFVKERFRKQGYAKELLEVCEAWARECNCTEFASDCELENITSLQFHLSVGFTEANRIICFKKEL